MRVLIVEDEPRLSATLSMGLKAEGFVVVTAGTGVEGLRRATESSFDVVVLDIMLPGHSGYEVLRRMRARDVWTPVLMLTAKDGEFDETDAFDLGADDYLTKPFSFRVLVARLRALVRRGAPERPAVLTVGTLMLDPARHTVQRGSTPITLTPREYGVLEFLMRNKDVVVTKAEILRNVWDAHHQGPDNVVEVYVGYVRRKIDVPFGTNTIETVRGVGYRLVG
ncbi:response regulator transcription factor [Mycobacterium terramassiliense]|uniref:DNA-binding response regulator, OmpR family, contains REC and winged-helix (WHTH) domain n=1 Tax=Mycobacterium terramassiliense TaxID=1841859 RepID=A0A2U3N8J3_9MYCO|nr:response regulator transcription factor [Mycobacterium terramassiliense]SPM27845.1 DNA-binding response regulator, OmpR family, contains REC and winged-helix (wHTH) domain [Mycobacterium terramassiliense]